MLSCQCKLQCAAFPSRCATKSRRERHSNANPCRNFLLCELERIASRPAIETLLYEIRERKAAAGSRVRPSDIFARTRPPTGSGQSSPMRPFWSRRWLTAGVRGSGRNRYLPKVLWPPPNWCWSRLATFCVGWSAPVTYHRLRRPAAYRNLLQLDIKLFPFAPFAGRIWELRANLTSYDAWYVALAEALSRPLATLDKKINRAAGVKCKSYRATLRRRTRGGFAELKIKPSPSGRGWLQAG